MKKTVNDIKYLCNLLQYMSREPGLFSNGYIRYISIGRYAKYVDLHFMNGSIYNFDSYTMGSKRKKQTRKKSLQSRKKRT